MRAGEYWFESHDGLRLFSRVYPGPDAGAPVVLCLHGLMRNGRDFGKLAAQLAVRYRVVVPDVRGRGLSARDPNFRNYQIPVYLQDLTALLTQLGAPRVAIIGTSMGGLMAIALAASAPQWLTAIVLNDIGPEVDPVGLQRIRGYAGTAAPVRTWEEAIVQLRATYGSVWPGLSGDRWEELVRLSYRENASGIPQVDADPRIGELLRDTRGATPDLWPLWKTLARVPTLAIRGAHSDVLSAATLERMRRCRSDLKTLTVANRGHPPLLDEPECLAAIEDFLGGVMSP
ncbi:MAG: alpha/beta hydrolase [Gammaproteobacteria bacterium]|nr:alpha/beta hydrolase [Gammaproteobacteria bacterium]